SMCPGVAVELYYHRIPHEESEDMVSVSTGLPYTEMPYAFRYRKPGSSVPQGCSCNTPAGAPPAAGYSIIGGSYSKHATEQGGETIAAPPAGPETASSDPATEAPNILPPDENRPIRVVGPKFLPAPEAAADLQAPVHDPAL